VSLAVYRTLPRFLPKSANVRHSSRRYRRIECRRPDHQRPEDYQQNKACRAQYIRVEMQDGRNGIQRKRDKGKRRDKACCNESRPRPARRPIDAPSKIGSTGSVQGAAIVRMPASNASGRSGIGVKGVRRTRQALAGPPGTA
jgi:hypothetical protein